MLGEPPAAIPLRPQILEALDRAGNLMTIEDLYGFVLCGAVQLWMTDDARACMFTEIVTHPRVKAICSMYTAGDLQAALSMVPRIAKWALEQGCTRAEFFGRPGWSRVSPKCITWGVHGYAPLSELANGR